MSQVQPATVTIDGDTYKIYMLDPLVASDLLADLLAIVLPPIAALAGSTKLSKEKLKDIIGGDAELPDGSNAGFERAAVLFVDKLDKAKQREVIALLSKVTAVVMKDGKEPMLDTIFTVQFTGRLDAMYGWLAAALKVQFGSFFAKGVSGIKSAVLGLGLGR